MKGWGPALPLVLVAAAAFAARCSGPSEAPCPGAADERGQCRAPCSADGDCLLSERCADGRCIDQSPNRPAILEFSGPRRVEAGAVAELRFRTIFAARVLAGRLDDPSPEVLDTFEGTLEVGPLQEEEVWVLVAESASGRVEATHVIGVGSLTDDVQIERFTVDPTRIASPQDVVLRWSVTGASGPIQIFAGLQPVVETEMEAGEVTWPVERTTAFRLTAPGVPAPAVASATVTVGGSPGALLSFEALPVGPLERERGVLLRWESANGERLVLEEEGSLVIDLDRATGAIDRGAWLVVPNEGENTRYQARLTDLSGAESTRSLSVSVASEADPPFIQSFEVSRDRLDAAGTTPVEVEWVVSPASAQVSLYLDGGVVGAFPSQGRTTVNLASGQSRRLRIEARTPALLAEAERVVWRVVEEDDDNEDFDEAQGLGGSAVAGDVATPVPGTGEADFYAADSVEDGALEVRLLAPCAAGLRITVFDEQRSEIGNATAPTTGTCPEFFVAPTEGRYFIRVDRPLMARADYVLAANVQGPTCGDGQRARSEACDDGNRREGDGCSQMCTIDAGWDYAAALSDTDDAPLPEGTPVSLVPYDVGGDALDEGRAIVDLGNWTFPFFTENYVGFEVHTNGFISFSPFLRQGVKPQPDLDLGIRIPDAIVAPFMRDLRLGPDGRIAIRRYAVGGEPALDVVMDRLQPPGNANARLSAVLTLTRSGQIRIRYPTSGNEGLSGVSGEVGLQLSGPGFRYGSPNCGEICPIERLVGQALTFEVR